MTHRRSRTALRFSLLWVCVGWGPLVGCVQLEDGASNGVSARLWGMPERISGIDTTGSIAISSEGDVVVVWNDVGQVRARGYSAQGGWEEGSRQINRSVFARDDAIVAMDPAGNAIAVWSQDFDVGRIYSARYSAGSDWRFSEKIDEDFTGGLGPTVSVGANGTAVAAWTRVASTGLEVWANRYSPGSSWGAPARIGGNSADQVSGVRVAVAPDGSATAVWARSDGGPFDIWANRCSDDGEWGTPSGIGQEGSSDARSPQVGVDDQGNAIVVWEQFDGSVYDVWSNRYASGEGWGVTPSRVEDFDAGDATDPDIGVAGSGNAVAVWAQSVGSRADLWSSRYTVGSGWGAATRIDSVDAASAKGPQVGVDQEGGAIVSWLQSDGTEEHIWSNHYAPSAGWSVASPIDSSDRASPRVPNPTVARSGLAAVVWGESGSSATGLWVNRYE